ARFRPQRALIHRGQQQERDLCAPRNGVKDRLAWVNHPHRAREGPTTGAPDGGGGDSGDRDGGKARPGGGGLNLGRSPAPARAAEASRCAPPYPRGLEEGGLRLLACLAYYRADRIVEEDVEDVGDLEKAVVIARGGDPGALGPRCPSYLAAARKMRMA